MSPLVGVRARGPPSDARASLQQLLPLRVGVSGVSARRSASWRDGGGGWKRVARLHAGAQRRAAVPRCAVRAPQSGCATPIGTRVFARVASNRRSHASNRRPWFGAPLEERRQQQESSTQLSLALSSSGYLRCSRLAPADCSSSVRARTRANANASERKEAIEGSKAVRASDSAKENEEAKEVGASGAPEQRQQRRRQRKQQKQQQLRPRLSGELAPPLHYGTMALLYAADLAPRASCWARGGPATTTTTSTSTAADRGYTLAASKFCLLRRAPDTSSSSRGSSSRAIEN